MRPGERARQRRCLAFRVAVFLGISLAVVSRGDTTPLAIALAGTAVLVLAYWRNCRQSRHVS
jgi:hypothetical protein